MLLKEQSILGIDATNQSISVGLMIKGVAKGSIYLNTGAPSSETLLASIDRLLAEARVEKHELQGVCVTLGPGSFTSMRISLSIAEALGLGLNIPVYGTDCLSVMASTMPFYPGKIKVIQNAYKGELYTATFDTSSGKVVALEEIRLIKPQDFYDQLEENDLLLGNGIAVLENKKLDISEKKVRANQDFHRLGSGIAVIEQFLDTEEREPSPLPLEPIYVRLSEAEINYKQQFGV